MHLVPLSLCSDEIMADEDLAGFSFSAFWIWSVEICITLGRMTDSPFSPVNRFPPNDHRLYTRPHVKYPGKVDLLYSIR
jgi:hypothetical protein